MFLFFMPSNSYELITGSCCPVSAITIDEKVATIIL